MSEPALAQHIFSDKCRRIAHAITDVESIIQALLQQNIQFPLRYPLVGIQNSPSNSFNIKRGRSNSQWSNSSDCLPSTSSSSVISSTSSTSSAYTDDSGIGLSSHFPKEFYPKPLSILSLDLKLQHSESGIPLESLEHSSTSALLGSKLQSVLGHLSKLGMRVSDVQSKILVTGDLNAGKSTLINALLKRPALLPTDQQPCTTNLCEVLDAEKYNCGVEEVHAIPVASLYSRDNPKTFKRFPLHNLERLACDSYETFEILKVYCLEPSQPSSGLLQNEVQISLIDSPGLNRDSLKTMAVFAREQEVDVIVFVVNAENHFTLSAQEFLLNASKEKSYVFVVVNRFDAIRDKQRCKSNIVKQLEKISPCTFQESSDLVHFISAEQFQRCSLPSSDLPPHLSYPGPSYPSTDWNEEEHFHRMEERLRSFILDKRTRTKLAPAKNYLLNLLGDLGVTSTFNHSIALSQLSQTTQALSKHQASLQKYRDAKDHFLLSLRQIAISACDQVEHHGKSRFADFVDRLEDYAEMPGWYGLFHIFQYIEELREGVMTQLEWRLKQCRDHAKRTIVDTLHTLQQTTKDLSTDLPTSCINQKITPTSINSFFANNAMKKEDIHKQIHFSVEPTDFVDEAKVGAFFIGLSAAGFSCTFSGLWRLGNNVGAASIGKMACGIGLATVCYAVSDMRSCVQRKMLRKIRKQLRQSHILDIAVQDTVTTTGHYLEPGVVDLQTEFRKSLHEKELQHKTHLRMQEEAKQRIHFFEGILTKVDQVESLVSAIDTEERLTKGYIPN